MIILMSLCVYENYMYIFYDNIVICSIHTFTVYIIIVKYISDKIIDIDILSIIVRKLEFTFIFSANILKERFPSRNGERVNLYTSN